MTKTEFAKRAALSLMGGATAAVATAIPLVDDGLLMSEALSIALAGLVGTGLTAAPSALLSPKAPTYDAPTKD